eukprot:5815128-Alexandrium_andersonii.AAC.1
MCIRDSLCKAVEKGLSVISFIPGVGRISCHQHYFSGRLPNSNSHYPAVDRFHECQSGSEVGSKGEAHPGVLPLTLSRRGGEDVQYVIDDVLGGSGHFGLRERQGLDPFLPNEVRDLAMQ